VVPQSDCINGWKDIATFLGVGVRTAQRWEVMAGLPVRRMPPRPRGSVFALRAELCRWRDGAPDAPPPAIQRETMPPRSTSRTPRPWVRFACRLRQQLGALAAGAALLFVTRQMK